LLYSRIICNAKSLVRIFKSTIFAFCPLPFALCFLLFAFCFYLSNIIILSAICLAAEGPMIIEASFCRA
jgi:ATP/ADP translocase